MNSTSCEQREAFGLRRVPALWLACLTDKKRRKAAQSKRFANFGCGFAAGRPPNRHQCHPDIVAMDFSQGRSLQTKIGHMDCWAYPGGLSSEVLGG